MAICRPPLFSRPRLSLFFYPSAFSSKRDEDTQGMPPRLPHTLATVPCPSSSVQLSSRQLCVNAGVVVVTKAHFHGRCRLESSAPAWSLLSSAAAAGGYPCQRLRCCDGIERGGLFGGMRRRNFHTSRALGKSAFEGKNHYERLKVSTNATPAEIKK